MAKKCKRDKCSTILPPSELHKFCELCRANSKGDDPCTKGKSCGLCEKMHEERVLDEPEEQSNKTATGNTGTKMSMEESLAMLASQMSSLQEQWASFRSEKSDSSKPTKTATATVSSANAANASQVRDEPVPVDGEESPTEDKTEFNEREQDPTFVEIVQTVKNLLDIADPTVDDTNPPSAFYKKATFKTAKKQLTAFPPEEDIHSMWSYREEKAAGKDSKGRSTHAPLHPGQFLPYLSVAIENFLAIPQTTTLKPQHIPESFNNLAKERLPGSITIPVKQFDKNERALRETIQILERLVYYKKAISELNARIQGLAEDALETPEKYKEFIEMIVSSNSMQSKIFDTVEFALETVLNQVMTLTCNLTLAKRDALLKCCPNVSSEDAINLRNSSFTDTDIFPHSLINTAENNTINN